MLKYDKCQEIGTFFFISKSLRPLYKTFSKYDPPKEFYDKYSKSTFKGSKISKLVETDVEDDKISEIRSNTNLYLETEKDGEEEKYFENYKNKLNIL